MQTSTTNCLNESIKIANKTAKRIPLQIPPPPGYNPNLANLPTPLSPIKANSKADKSKSKYYGDLESIFSPVKRDTNKSFSALVNPSIGTQFKKFPLQSNRNETVAVKKEDNPPISILRKSFAPSSRAAEYRVSFDHESNDSVVERSIPKLAPKQSNPSLPDLSFLSKPPRKSCNNPFSPEFCSNVTKEKDMSNVKAYRLGEMFFNSLFPSNVKSETNHCNSKRAIAVPAKPKNNSLSSAAPETPGEISRTGKSGLLPAHKPLSDTNSGGKPVEPKTDRYAALKDLDEIFKSSVAIQDSKLVLEGCISC